MNLYLNQAIEKNTENGYLRYHAPRYDKLLTLLQQYHKKGQRVLDIGRSPFTLLAAKSLQSSIDTLGFESNGETETGFNYQLNLNDVRSPQRLPTDIPKYNIIVFSEVIEHLYTSPKLVLKYLHSLLYPNGIIIIQTPNGVVAHKRIQMLLGYNPYSLISEDLNNPAHFREYTARELSYYCHQAGFKIEKKTFENYFDYRYTAHSRGSNKSSKINHLVNIFYQIIPYCLRPGLCFIIRADNT